MIFGCGGLEQGLTMDYAKLIMDAEMNRMILNAATNIPFDEEELALDIIGNVGPGGSFLVHEHTLHHMRDQSWPQLFDRKNLEDWCSERAGTSLLEQAYTKAVEIIDSHQPPKLPVGADLAIQEIIREFESKAGIVEKCEPSYAISA